MDPCTTRSAHGFFTIARTWIRGWKRGVVAQLQRAGLTQLSAPERADRMARGRFISRTIAASEQLGRVSLYADYLFTRCIPHLDVKGRLTGEPKLLKATAVPLRAEIKERSIPRLIEELGRSVGPEGQSLVVWYESRGVKVLWFPGFERHNGALRRERESPSRHPELNPDARVLSGVVPPQVPISTGVNPERRPESSGVTPSKGKVEGEGKREAKSQVGTAGRRSTAALTELPDQPQPAAPISNTAATPQPSDDRHGPGGEVLREQRQVLEIDRGPRSVGIESGRVEYAHPKTRANDAPAAFARNLVQQQAGQFWPDLQLFLASRTPHTHSAWLREFSKLTGPGSQFTWADLALACNDGLALEEPLTGPQALRAFTAKAHANRIAPRGAPTITETAANTEQLERRREERYYSARRTAALAWAAGNPDADSEIRETVERELPDSGDPIARMTRERALVSKRAAAAGFPPFEQWVTD